MKITSYLEIMDSENHVVGKAGFALTHDERTKKYSSSSNTAHMYLLNAECENISQIYF